MAAQAEASTAAMPRNQQLGIATSYLQGTIAGIFGAVMIAVWFFALDVAWGRPLYTPTLLGSMLLHGGAALPDIATPLHGSLRITLVFTIVHGVVFVLLGVATAGLLNMAARGPNIGMGILLLFVVLQLSFLAFVMSFAAVTLDALGMPEVIIGNLLAATAIGGYLFWHRPASPTSAGS